MSHSFKRIWFTVWASILILASVQTSNAQAPTLELLAEWMEGSFTSKVQSTEDDRFLNVSLNMRTIASTDETVLIYVEQALASKPESPYRQRVYRLSKRGAVFISETLEMENPRRFVGAWKTPSLLKAIPSDSLISKSGCTVFLVWNNAGYFEGKTEDQRCESKINGASFATSEVKIYSDRVESWDRGFSLAGNQVWGSKFGAYVFTRHSREAE